jgi:hypothetical protein
MFYAGEGQGGRIAAAAAEDGEAHGDPPERWAAEAGRHPVFAIVDG